MHHGLRLTFSGLTLSSPLSEFCDPLGIGKQTMKSQWEPKRAAWVGAVLVARLNAALSPSAT